MNLLNRNRYFASILLAGIAGAAFAAAPEAPSAALKTPLGYVLGPNDEISVQALHVPELDGKPVHIEQSGTIELPLIGGITAAGLTADQLRARIRERLDTYVRDPEVRVEILAFRSQPVTVMGAVRNPGMYYLQGPTGLASVLSLAGGLLPEASDLAQIRRESGCGAALPGAPPEAGSRSTATVRISELMRADTPGEVLVCRNDVVSVPRARLVYVLGEVRRPGGFPLRDGESVSVLQALSLAEGPTHTAGMKHARLLRPTPGQAVRAEREIDLSKLMEGKQADVPLTADDILFVPNSASRSAALRAIEAAIQTGTGVAIWRR